MWRYFLTKQHSSQWKSQSFPNKAEQTLRSHLTFSLPVEVWCTAFTSTGQTVNLEFYLTFLHHLREAVWKKWPELSMQHSRFLHHDNAPMHTVFSVHRFLMKNKTPVVPQPKFVPDPSPADFFSVPKMKS